MYFIHLDSVKRKMQDEDEEEDKEEDAWVT